MADFDRAGDRFLADFAFGVLVSRREAEAMKRFVGRVASLNPKNPEIGAGMLASLVEEAARLQKIFPCSPQP